MTNLAKPLICLGRDKIGVPIWSALGAIGWASPHKKGACR
jgi:hypothetical protein